MKYILPWLFWGTGAAWTSFAFVDWVLLDRDKKRIHDRAAEFWNWLDDQRERKYLAYLRKFRWQRFIAIVYAILTLISALFIGYGVLTREFDGTDHSIGHKMLGTFVGSFVVALFMARTALPRLLNWVTKNERSWAYLLRSTLALVVTIAATFAAWTTLVSLSPGGLVSGQEWHTWNSFSSPTTALFYGICESLIFTPVSLILISWLLVVLPVIFVLLLTVLFRAAQFVAVRVAEHPKGPQYALSALFGAIGCAVSRFTQLMAAGAS